MSRKLFLLILMVAAFALPLSALAQPAPNDPSDVSPLGTEFRISISDEEDLNSVGHGTSLHALAMDNDGDAVVLMFDMMPEWTLQARLYDGNAQPKGPQFIVADENLGGLGDYRGADVAMDADGDFVVAWEGVYARLYTAAGNPKGAAFEVAPYEQNSFSDEVAVAADDAGNFIVVWARRDWAAGSTYTLYARRFWANGSPRGGTVVVAPTVGGAENADYESPDVAVDADGDYVISWVWHTPDTCGSRVQRHNAAGAAEGAVINLPGCDQTRVAADSARNFVVVWEAPDQSDRGIFARRYLANGTPNGAQFQVNTASDAFQFDPAVAMNDAGAMYIAWGWDYREQKGQMNAGSGVYGRRYGANGAALGDPFRINSFGGGNPGSPRVALDNQGDFLAAWGNEHQDGGNSGVYGQYGYPTTPNIPILLSLMGNGRVRGLNYTRGDILKYDPAADQWSIFWDASDHHAGAANVGDFELLDDGDLLLVFKSPVTLPGVGKVQPHDIARFDAATATYSFYFDGSDVGLTLQSERLDALGMEADGSLLLSTVASFAVPGLTGVDEDTFRFQPASLGANTAGSWTYVLMGVTPKDLWSLWVDTVSPDPYYYMTFERPVRVHDNNTYVPNGGILRCRPVYPQLVPFGYSYCVEDLYWSGAAAGLSAGARIDGLELVTR